MFVNLYEEYIEIKKERFDYFNELLEGNITDNNDEIEIASCQFKNKNRAKAMIITKNNKKYYRYQLLNESNQVLLESKLEEHISNEGFMFDDYFDNDVYKIYWVIENLNLLDIIKKMKSKDDEFVGGLSSPSFEEAIINFAADNGVKLEEADIEALSENMDIDSDGYPYIESKVKIKSLDLTLNITAYHHVDWDFYLE